MNTIPTHFSPDFCIHQKSPPPFHHHQAHQIHPPPSFSHFPLQNASIFPRYQINVLKEEILVFQTVFL